MFTIDEVFVVFFKFYFVVNTYQDDVQNLYNNGIANIKKEKRGKGKGREEHGRDGVGLESRREKGNQWSTSLGQAEDLGIGRLPEVYGGHPC